VIVPVPVLGQEQRTAGLAQQLSERFGIPVADRFTWTGPPVPAELSSSVHVQHVERQLSFAGDPVNGRVLLLAATGRSLWTTTVAAALLRESGANEVLPLVVHRLP